MRFDILIKNGWLLDGTGNPWFPSEVGIKDGKIVKILPTIDGSAKKIIDASGHIVCPGFIDMHSHSDAFSLLTGEMESSVGMKLIERTNVTIKNLQIHNFNYGIQLQRSSNNTILGNFLLPIGINLQGAHNNVIIENNFEGNNWGIGIMIDNGYEYGNSSGNHFLGNNITNQAVGINSIVGSANVFSGNNILNCNIYGILLESYPNQIVGNNIENNSVGIFFSHGASNNTIYDNNFINNQKDMDDAHSVLPYLYEISINNWDNCSRGNYWSVYNGTDNDGDGIGDNPHLVYETNEDNYPLINQVDISEIPEFPSWAILPLFLITSFIVIVCKKIASVH